MQDARMPKPSNTACSRREALGTFAGLLASGLWPGAALAATAGTGVEEFDFVAANDFHHENAGCDPWFTRLFRQIGRHPGAAFCLGIGDLANQGKPESIAAIRRFAGEAQMPFYPVPGNHDNDLTDSPEHYASVFPQQVNYSFTYGGWQFVGLDTTDGKKYQQTVVQPETLGWLDRALSRLDRRRPTVLFTHFPLAAAVKYCPTNAESVLERFKACNLRAVLSGHFHGRTATRRADYELVTNACCARVRNNHDGTNEKGYWLCRACADGTITRTFQLFAG
jgi:3',5'-cyclic AMP phosphodiesterase CpdA